MGELYIGLMSGTSADGVDAALVQLTDDCITILHAIDIPYPHDFRQRILQLALSDQCTKFELASVSAELADFFALAIKQLLSATNTAPQQIAAIGSHGHTIDHAPNNLLAYTLQITDHARLTEQTGISVVCDFRSRDVAAGGQGAPLVPAFHRWLFKTCGHLDSQDERAFINIGGISNITLVNQGMGFDCGPGNCLLDHWHHMHTGEYFDNAGRSARQGKLIPELLDSMLAEDYFSAQAPKSTGREHFNQQWLDRHLLRSNHCWQDISHTLTALTAKTITDQLNLYSCQEAFICGGGSHNQLLIEMMRDFAPTLLLKTTSDLGIHPDWMEAAAFAWLARQTLNGRPGNLPSATGAKGERILGAIYPA